MADVFISYASEDRERVRPLAEALIARGLSVWWDRALAAGDDYAAVIRRELDAAKAVLAVWTAASTASPWVRDEAGRARDAGRLVPVLLDRVEIPLGFGQVHAEDLTAWSGQARAPQIDLLVESLKARIEGRAPDGEAIAAKRKRTARRVRLVSALTVLALVVAIGAGASVIYANRQAAERAQAAARAQDDQLAQLLALVEQGKITGDQAVELARLLQAQAFQTVAAPAGSTPEAQEAPAEAPAVAMAQAEEAPVSAQEAQAAAGESYAQALAVLLQDPDPRVRRAAVQASNPQTQEQGAQAMIQLANEGGAASGALWRAAGSLLAARGDPRAVETLENARARNPQDKAVWRMLSFVYARSDNASAAQGAAMVSEGLVSAAEGRPEEAARILDAALPRLTTPESRAFVLGQLGDAAASRQDWAEAATRYSEAVRLHRARGDAGALSVDASKLARALVAQGKQADACGVLQRAQAAGAAVTAEELARACPQGDPAPPAQVQPMQATRRNSTLAAP